MQDSNRRRTGERRGLVRELISLLDAHGPAGAIRFVERHSIPEPNSGCWLYEGTLNSQNYGTISDPSVPANRDSQPRVMVHKLVCEALYGSLAGKMTRRRCNNPPCVNPDHMQPGSRWKSAVIAGLFFLAASSAFAAPPAPNSKDAEIMRGHEGWLEKQASPSGQWCCTSADGRPLFDNEIRVRDGHYEVLYSREHWGPEATEQWLPVAADAILKTYSPVGMPIAWIFHGRVLCLVLGAQG